MKRLLSATRNDLVLQYRHYFYHVYAVVTVAYALIVRFLPLEYRQTMLSLTIFTDPAIYGFLFVAALVLFEKDARSLQAIRITPLQPAEYLWAKALSLSALAVVAGLALALLSGSKFNPLLLIPGIAFTATIHVLLGFALVVRFSNLSSFLVGAIPAITLLSLPVLTLLGVWQSATAFIVPGQGGLNLIAQAFSPAPNVWQAVISLLFLGVWNWVAYTLAKRQYMHYVVQGSGI